MEEEEAEEGVVKTEVKEVIHNPASSTPSPYSMDNAAAEHIAKKKRAMFQVRVYTRTGRGGEGGGEEDRGQ
jgi:hypothetical protein